jgi:alpha-N-acetylglucosamine transferase
MSMSLGNNLAPRCGRIIIASVLLIGIIIFFTSLGRPLSDYTAQIQLVPHRNGSTQVPAKNHDAEPSASSLRWSDFAYVQYVTNPSYLCNSLMILEALRRYGTKADLLMLYPQQWALPEGDGGDGPYEGKLLAKARDVYGTKLSPIQVKTFKNEDDPTWQDSYTKLYAWSQTQYKRLISLDSDATVLDVSISL